MSASLLTAPPPPVTVPVSEGRGRAQVRRLAIWVIVLAALAGVVWVVARAYQKVVTTGVAPIPVARVRRGDVTFTVHALGELRGGNSETLTAPMTGGGEIHITFLRKSGERVAPGDKVVEFDTTEQEFNLREAEADVAEAEQKVAQARAQLEAQKEENSYALLKAKSDVRLAELEAQKDPISATITAKENDMAVTDARATLAELEQNLNNQKSTDEAAIAMQEAARGKAQVQAAAARRNIDAMTLTAHRAGYVAVKLNTALNFFIDGMTLSPFQVGDRVNPGMAVVEIPDLDNWEVTATIAEVDRGHIATGQQAEVQVIGAPGQRFNGRVKDLGGTTGSPWDRHFDCRITLEHPAPELRPGMSARVAITTDTVRGALWLPAQAMFEENGRTFVYVPSGNGFAPRDVKLVRRSESQVVISGLPERQVVALADPSKQAKKKSDSSTSASQAISK
jgi:HlyD family secretion protein